MAISTGVGLCAAGASHYKKGIDRVFSNTVMKDQFLAEHQQEYAVKTMRGALAVSESGYSACKQREPNRRQVEDQQLMEQIQHACQRGRQV